MKNPFKKPFNDIPFKAYAKWAMMFRVAWESKQWKQIFKMPIPEYMAIEDMGFNEKDLG